MPISWGGLRGQCRYIWQFHGVSGSDIDVTLRIRARAVHGRTRPLGRGPGPNQTLSVGSGLDSSGNVLRIYIYILIRYIII